MCGDVHVDSQNVSWRICRLCSMIGSHFPVEPKPPLPLLVDGSSCGKERKTLKYCMEASNVMLEHYYNGISE